MCGNFSPFINSVAPMLVIFTPIPNHQNHHQNHHHHHHRNNHSDRGESVTVHAWSHVKTVQSRRHIPLAALIQRVWFSFIWCTFKSFPPFRLFKARSSIVSLTAKLMNFESKTPSFTFLHRSIPAGSIGNRYFISGSGDKQLFKCSAKADISSSANEWVPPDAVLIWIKSRCLV